ncbi:GlsB/YeaQ/YmgE family stress response membrane protein [Psychromarinibacter sp. S121]|uniref:GlsB/YeaQ/YmgE family stress response membrane protein n=1 Tax=Psychromarinibacter sp. S121 TaxID=3415127 RepID=UPI003C7D7B98
MEGVLGAMGVMALVIMAVIGLLAGWIAGTVAGRNRGMYMLLGVVGACAAPFLFAALGIGLLAAWGVFAIIVFALIGSVVVLFLGKLLFDR